MVTQRKGKLTFEEIDNMGAQISDIISTIENISVPTTENSSGYTNTNFAKSIGMIPNDVNEAVSNSNKLITALNLLPTIVIDDSYYLGQPSVILTSSSVTLIGIGGELKFNQVGEFTLFDSALISNLIVRDLKFTNLSNDSVRLFYNNSQTSADLGDVSITKCVFNGNIRCYQMVGSYSIDPLITYFGLNSFTFLGNEINNTKSSFIVLPNLPVRQLVISNNKITNFVYTFLNFATENTATNTNNLLTVRKICLIEDNFVYCDIDWWGLTGAGTYFTFALVENDTAIYKGNHVEGLKTSVDISLYDCYLSSRVVYHVNNVWKNNIVFTTTKTNNYLLKSKGGGTNLERVYKNNTYIVEESFASDVGQTTDKLFVQFIDLTGTAEKYVIQDNLFDIYDLRGRVSSIEVANMIADNNIFRGYRVQDNLFQLKSDGIGKTATIRNNTIDFESDEGGFRLLRMYVSNSSYFESVVIENNYIKAAMEYVLYDIRTQEYKLYNNRFISTRASGNTSGIGYGGRYINSHMENNIFERVASDVFYEARGKYVEGSKHEISKCFKKNTYNNNNALQIGLDISVGVGESINFRRRYKVYTSTGVMEFVCNFKVISADGVPHISFTNTGDSDVSYEIGTAEGNLDYIKLIDIGEVTNTLTFRFYNSATSTYFIVNNFNNLKEWIEIETTTA